MDQVTKKKRKEAKYKITLCVFAGYGGRLRSSPMDDFGIPMKTQIYGIILMLPSEC